MCMHMQAMGQPRGSPETLSSYCLKILYTYMFRLDQMYPSFLPIPGITLHSNHVFVCLFVIFFGCGDLGFNWIFLCPEVHEDSSLSVKPVLVS